MKVYARFAGVLGIAALGVVGCAQHATPLDLDVEMVSLAASNCTDTECADAFFCAADAADIPFRNTSMDTIFGFGFLHHVPAWKTSMDEIARVLKPGGTYFFEEYYPGAYRNWITRRLLVHPEKDRFNSQDLHHAFQEANLTLTHSFELKRMGILGVGVKADSQSISCAHHEDACQVVLE